jgi:hypothetical protein
MVWTAPRTWVSGEVLTAALLNTHVRDNLNQAGPAVVTTAGDLVYATGANALARVAIGAAGYGLLVDQAGTAFEYAEVLPWLIDLPVFNTTTNTNWSTLTVEAAAIHNGLKDSSGAQNASIEWEVPLAAGTWDIEVTHAEGSSHGIASVRFDGVEKGTIDFYTAGTNWNQQDSVTGIAVASPAVVTVSLVMATKNASSSGYAGRINGVRLRRTA